MVNKRRKYIFVILFVALAALVCSALYFISPKKTPAPADGSTTALSQEPAHNQLSITNLYVGKADCAVIECEGSIGIIDAGTLESYNLISGYLQKKGISNIDYLILTHYDKDHIGGAIPLLTDYSCEDIYLADYVSQKQYYPDLMSLVHDRDNVYFVTEPISFTRGKLSLEIIPADEPTTLLENEDNRDNNMSLVTMMTYGSKKFLFTGDIEKDRIAQMLSFHDDLAADWIKMPHHGGYQKIVSRLLETVLPKYAVITTSSERPPDDKLIELLKEDNILTFDTMTSNVYTICDGEEITVTMD